VALALPVVWTDAHRLHDPAAEIWVGMRTPATEVAERAERIRAALTDAGARFVSAERHLDDALLAVHAEELVDYLRGAWDEWERAGLATDPGQDRVVPYFFPHPGLVGDLDPREPVAPWARPGMHCFDTMTLVGPGTWEAARNAVDAALTAADLVLVGEHAAYACCRPPGHHVTRTAYGGSCYLNNAAVAAEHLRRAGLGGVAIVDVDAHHGNGAQSIFWRRGDVFTGSIHVDPGAGWFPHFLGFADERGSGPGEDTNLNVPLAPGTGDDTWLAALDTVVEAAREHASDALVVALGVDAATGDTEAPLGVGPAGFRAAGRRLGAVGLPTVFVQEGGYDLEAIGRLVRELLEGFEEGAG
jgi:acetoin utilization deacetylase AcuC-like enzyme